ncbi:Gfo/Idh/MocA family oxidoreductase [Alkalibacterium kapii]|uniref:Dehydrogenase n=1 Tax=Alkalibacterium kapii TaxID=426704 RepID=A0A511ASS0_9LACT|nr:Gfo/Idh/MocA family oxidoreductase [Alkalibacterium kapii]GEK91146.1 dehydrogenase [Alkalibacterium kapii]
MLNIAYIGDGKSTNRYHIPFSTQVEGINIKMIQARSGHNEEWERVPGVDYVKDKTAIYNDSEIDLVVICTPPESHYELAKETLLNNKHVLVEKPFAETSEEAKELFDLAEEKGLFIQCYQNRRFDSDFLTVQKVIESGVIGDILEVEMHFDYFRPEVPENAEMFDKLNSFMYTHACHTVDQVLSYFGNPVDIHYDVRQLLGDGRMNDYFDLDFNYTNNLKVSVKSSYFRLKGRPSFAIYGKKGAFIKETKDRQEEHLKLFYMPVNNDFGVDLPEHYGTLYYMDDKGHYHEEKVVSEVGDYSRIYKGVYESIVNGKEKIVKDEETIRQIEILEEGISEMKNY